MKRILLFSVALMATATMFATEGALTGKFSVAPGRQVYFSQGLLQFNAAQGQHKCADGSKQNGTWRFAPDQLSAIGEANTNVAEDYDGWIDLFGWGASGYNGRFPWIYTWQRLSDVPTTDNPAMYDYGTYNAISNGGNKPGLWRCLTNAEWEYLLEKRLGARDMQQTVQIGEIVGLVILPDVKSLKEYNAFFQRVGEEEPEIPKTMSLEQWKKYEANGAVFIPVSGLMRLREEGWKYDGGWDGGAWSAPYNAASGNAEMGMCYFSKDHIGDQADVYDYDRVKAHGAVRLVKNVK